MLVVADAPVWIAHSHRDVEFLSASAFEEKHVAGKLGIGSLYLPLRLHGRLTVRLLHDFVAMEFAQVDISGEHKDRRSRLRSATARSRRSAFQGFQR